MKRIMLLVLIVSSFQLCLGQRIAPHGEFEASKFSHTSQPYFAISKDYAPEQRDEMDPPTNLEATLDGNDVHLTWNHPDPGSQIIFSDSFESYPDFALQFPPWVLVDGDLGLPYFCSYADWPNTATAQSFIIFNPSATMPPITDMPVHNGSKFAACVANSAGPNDDWMMSPILNVGTGSQLSFWARSYIMPYGLDRFRVMISGGSTNPDDFIALSPGEYTQAPTVWTQYTYDLTAYAGQSIRFAIQCVTNDAFILMLDDIVVSDPGLSRSEDRALLGYKVYRDGILLQTISDPQNCAYDDLDMEYGLYTYTVTAIYSSGESIPAGPLSVNISNLHPPQNLVATTDDHDVTLLWDGPAPPSNGEWISWSDYEDVWDNSIGTGTQALFDVAQMFDAADLAEYQGDALTHVKFVSHYENCVYTVKVWTGGSATEPGMLVYSGVQSNVNDNDWSIHVLSTPIPIPPDRLWIGYEIDTMGGYPAGCDDGPSVPGKGDLINIGGWTTLTEISPYLSYNWQIKGFVDQGRSLKNVAVKAIAEQARQSVTGSLSLSHNHTIRHSRALTGYRIKRNGVELGLIADPSATSYLDPGLSNGTYSYAVSAVYSDGESFPAMIDVTLDAPTEDMQFGDGFETYQDFSAVFAPWTTIDMDLSDTYGFFEIDFPGNLDPMSYIVFNPSATTPPMTDAVAHEGTRMLASFASINPPNNDWVITPRLNLGTGSMLRFYARSHTNYYGLERFQVGISTEPELNLQSFQFVSGASYIEAPTHWTEFVYDLSAYNNQSVFIGIRCVSWDAMILYLDDIAIYSSNSNDDPFGYPQYMPYSTSVSASVSIAGVAAEAQDVVAAFVNVNGVPQLRGKAILQDQDGVIGCQLQVYTHNLAETVYFKVWQRSTEEIFTAPVTLQTNGNGVVGQWPDNPYQIDAYPELTQNLALQQGWNLVSLNVDPVDPSLRTVLYPIASHVLEFKNQNGIYIPGNPYGQLHQVDIGKAYSVKMNFATQWDVTGFSVDESTPIVVADGWNMLGYLPVNPMPVADALQSIMPWLLEVKGGDGVYIPGNPYSTLSMMQPGKGYWIRVSGFHELVYPSFDPSTMAECTYDHTLPVQTYPQSMVLLARCDWAETGDILIARVGEELRGAQRLVSPEGFPAALLQIYIKEAGEEICLYILKADGTELPVSNKLQGNANATLGAYPDFVSLYQKTSDPVPDLASRLDGCYPNPFNPSTTITFSIADDDTEALIKVYNLRGQQVAQLGGAKYKKGTHQLVFNAVDHKGQALSSGVYIIALKAGSYCGSAKVLLLK